MTARGHILLATGLAGSALYLLKTPPDIYFLAGLAFGAVLPDIDEPKSLIGRKLYFLAFILRLFGVEHRTLSHSVLFALIFLAPVLFVPYPYNSILLGVGIGVIMHCVGDMLTISGLKYFLYPQKIELHLLPKELRFRTGGTVEEVIVFLLLIFNIFLFKKLGIVEALHNFNPSQDLGLPNALKSIFYYFLNIIHHNFHT